MTVIVGGGGVLIVAAYYWRCTRKMGSWEPFIYPYGRYNPLQVIRTNMINALRKCDAKDAADIAHAIAACPLVGRFTKGGSPDGQDGTSLTYKNNWACWPRVVLAHDFFTRTSWCSKYYTLVKECYLRASLANYDDTAASDNTQSRIFEAIECCLDCCGHVNPSKWRKKKRGDGSGILNSFRAPLPE